MSSEVTQRHLFSRQPLSTLGKIAVGGFLISMVLCGIIALILTFATGSPSRDIITAVISMLVCALLLVSGVRWVQAAGVLAGIYVLYLMFTEPFVIESLALPKGPNGGYGHFVGDIIICACTLVAFAASIGVLGQNYGQRDRQQSPRWFRPAINILVGIAIGSLLIGAISQPPAAASTGTTYTNGVPTVHMSAGSFAQSSVAIPKGSKLLLVDDSSSVHILANGSWQNNTARPAREAGAPAVNNLQVSGNSVEIGPFTLAGTYHIYCTVHTGMELAIIVQ